MLLIRSSEGIPEWISQLESQKLAVGECDFTCCERNHEGVFEKCTRNTAFSTLIAMISKKAEYLFQMGNTLFARWTVVLEPWWTRELSDDSSTIKKISIRDLLKWTEIDEEQDTAFNHEREEVSLLMYAAARNDTVAARDILKDVNSEYVDRRVSREGIPEYGIIGHTTALMIAMAVGGPEVVALLLEAGADADVIDVNGSNSLMFSQQAGRNSDWVCRVYGAPSTRNCQDTSQCRGICQLGKF